MEENEITDRAENGNGQMEEEGRPRDINIVQFAKERITQIADLIDAIENRSLVSGEVTKGPRTALQRLPRHMRRRAMSYNIKRFPRNQRRFAASAVKASKHRKKAPSRFWRRRPRNLLLNYIRRQRKHIWLETHVWHAKRFYMCDKWGYRLALRSYQRAYRATYRDAMRHCTIRDTSFIRCFQIFCGGNENDLISALRPLCEPSASATFAFKSALENRFEITTLLFESGKYPFGFIGPVRFCWTGESKSEWRSLIIWCHPSYSASLLNRLIELLKLTKDGSGAVDEQGSATEQIKQPKTLNEWRLQNSRIQTDIYRGDGNSFKLIDLSDQLNRFRLHGPQSFAVLRKVLKTVSDDESLDDWMRTFATNNTFWNVDLRNISSGELADGTILSLLVEDPRLSRPIRKTKPDDDKDSVNASIRSVQIDQLPKPRSAEFWNLEYRQKVLASKLSESVLQRQRANSLASVCTSPAKIPILLIVRNSGTGTSSTFAGVDLIVPNGFGMEFWLALQYGTAHASALHDQKCTEFESNRFNFPSDIPDCDAGRCEVNDERDELIKKYLSRPHNRRVKYWSSLRVKYPFSFEWSSLVHEWLDSTSCQTDSETNPSNDFYVIRDRRQLLVIDKWLSGKVPLPDDTVKQNQKALVPVRLDVLTTGRPQRFALICAPSDDDFSAIIKWNSNRETVKLEEVEPESVNKTEHEIEEEDEKEEEKEENKVGMEEDFIEVNCLKKETPISLNALFPDKAILRNQKRIAVKRLKRQKWKAAKRRRKDVVGSEKTTDESGSWQDGVQNSLNKVADFDQSENISYKESCSRLIIGRVVRGDYSFCSAKGRALGYCSLEALKRIRKRNVLFRNVTSKYYHPAKISILRTQPDI